MGTEARVRRIGPLVSRPDPTCVPGVRRLTAARGNPAADEPPIKRLLDLEHDLSRGLLAAMTRMLAAIEQLVMAVGNHLIARLHASAASACGRQIGTLAGPQPPHWVAFYARGVERTTPRAVVL